jgi:redox-sensitive bicupin YhaK (pirin superfamily)
MTTIRPVLAELEPIHTFEGAGFGVFRPFPQPGLDLLDPFLLLDEMEPRTLSPGEAKGAPDHPHRGFETVTYILDGEFEHRDSHGHHGRITPGDIQWMTAGAGIVHSEMPSERLQREGGNLHGFQLWVNLPAADKMITPRYQALGAAEIPVARGEGWTARVIAGSFAGVDGVADTHTPVVYAHVTIEAGRRATFDIPADHNVAAYVFGGAARRFVVWERREGSIELVAGDEPLEVLVLAGRPLNEPVARYGPFVMNDRRQLLEAFEDYQAGRMGTILAQGQV